MKQFYLEPFGIGHMYIHTFLLIMTDIMTSQNSDLSSVTIVYIHEDFHKIYIYI
jgi:hypothetical protein